jgi:hypothetical protein
MEQKSYDWGQDEISRTPPRNPPSRQPVFLGLPLEQLTNACRREAAELKNWPANFAAQLADPSEAQRDALEHMRAIVSESSEALASACPKDVPGAVAQRIDTLDGLLAAFANTLDKVRPPVEAFYALLGDEEKARLVAGYLVPDGSLPERSQSPRNERPIARAPAPPQGAAGDSPCRKWAEALRAWPVRQVESSIELSDAQHAALYEATAAIYRAVDRVAAACGAASSFTPVGQLDRQRKQIDAVRQSLDVIRTPVGRFAESLNDGQKTRLAELGIDNAPDMRSSAAGR